MIEGRERAAGHERPCGSRRFHGEIDRTNRRADMTPDAVASYLKQHPEFFEEYADFLGEIFLPHPHGGRAISINERQVLALREKSRKLEGKLRELIEFGEENDSISEKLHRLTLALVAARSIEVVISALHVNLREDFAVPHVAVRLWPEGLAAGLPEFAPVSAEAREFTASLAAPYCSARPMVDTAAWFGEEAARLRSFAYVPLPAGRALGMLVLASEDPQRFYPEMGTMYLKRLGDVAAAAVQRYCAQTS
jgi:uncharacterized protein YigA (DUF484 family)